MEKNTIIIGDKKGKSISGLKLLDGGMKGLQLSYMTSEVQDGMRYESTHDDKKKRPVHRELKELVKQLKPYFLELCGYSEYCDAEGLEALMMVTEVTGVTAGTDKFLITGKVRSWGDKVIGVSGPLIKEVDAYDEFDAVIGLVDKIYREADLYMQGIKKATKVEIIEDYMKDFKKNAEFKYIDFEAMTEEEQGAFMKNMDKELGIKVVFEDGANVIAADEGEPTFGDLNNINEIVPVSEAPLITSSKKESKKLIKPVKGETVVLAPQTILLSKDDSEMFSEAEQDEPKEEEDNFELPINFNMGED